ncbi:uncharacterized protein SAPINGB_P000038 [Magnusiomyces paraingens]|uniref:PQ-loop repeat-containing protein 1 n=1 Tax=Magnusiomyces paraingens TaxID=2606893 RepID=A0A5E8AWJ4_9ASCO|nr:uncharacterized protein SAPINGB_P000038 [Saprochaete ingens]VVT43553.1 unnamed protein product [Saprochaete ingens]
MISVMDIFSWKFFAGLILALSPIISYGDTVWTIYRTKQCVGFSLDLTAIMLISSILRIFFYFGEPYELSLLMQSIIMIVVQAYLLHLALKYRVLSGAPNGSVDEEDPLSEEPASTHTLGGTHNHNNHHQQDSGNSPSTSKVPSNKDSGPLLDSDPGDIGLSSRRKSISDVVHNTRPSRSGRVIDSMEESPSPTDWDPHSNYPKNHGRIKQHAHLFLEYRVKYPLYKIYYKVKDIFISFFTNKSGENAGIFGSAYPTYGMSTRPFGFWQWIDPEAYWVWLIKFNILLTVLHFLIGSWSMFYIQTLGFVGLMLEAILPLPQLIVNAQRHSVQGFRLSLLLNWLAGDASKIFYYLYGTSDPEKLAFQFMMCVVIQTILDLIGGWQYVYYNYIFKAPKSSTYRMPQASSSRPTSIILNGPNPVLPIPRDSIELDVVPFPDYAPRNTSQQQTPNTKGKTAGEPLLLSSDAYEATAVLPIPLIDSNSMSPHMSAHSDSDLLPEPHFGPSGHHHHRHHYTFDAEDESSPLSDPTVTSATTSTLHVSDTSKDIDSITLLDDIESGDIASLSAQDLLNRSPKVYVPNSSGTLLATKTRQRAQSMSSQPDPDLYYS